MKRSLFILLGFIALAAATAAVFLSLQRPEPPRDWLKERYGLNEEQFRRIASMQSAYQIRCAEMCARIDAADARLAELIRANKSVLPEVYAAIVEADKVRTDCRASMLAHFYEVAAELPAEKRADYLKIVLPAVLHPEGMASERVHP